MDHASIVNAVTSVKTYEDCQFVFTVLLDGGNGVPIETIKEAFDEAFRREKAWQKEVSAESARYAAEAAILAAKHAEEMREEIDEHIREHTTLWCGAPVWTPNNQWTKENWKDWREGEDIRCVECGEEYPEDHDGEGFENGKWYCCWCWDKKFLFSDEEETI